jgi:hypothetical protein
LEPVTGFPLEIEPMRIAPIFDECYDDFFFFFYESSKGTAKMSSSGRARRLMKL